MDAEFMSGRTTAAAPTQYRQGDPAGATRAQRKLTMQPFDLVARPTSDHRRRRRGFTRLNKARNVRFLAGGTTLSTL